MPPKNPPRRKGTALTNTERHNAATSLAQSARRYIAPKIQPLADNRPKPNFRRTKPVETIPDPKIEGQGSETPPASKPRTQTPKDTKPVAQKEAKPTTAEITTVDPSNRGNQAYAVRLLPAQVAVIEDIAARLNKDGHYAQQIVRRKVKELLNALRDENTWEQLGEEAERRINDPHGEGVDYFKSVFRITKEELAVMKSFIDDPMGMFTDFKITSAFAKAALKTALEDVEKATR